MERLKKYWNAIRENYENNKTTIERRYYICSIRADAKVLAKAARSHWGIENVHWILDDNHT